MTGVSNKHIVVNPAITPHLSRWRGEQGPRLIGAGPNTNKKETMKTCPERFIFVGN
jgi:hypothetical protein